MDWQSTQELQSPAQASRESQSEQPKNHTTDAPVTDSVSASASSNDSKKISRQDIDLVQNLIERCLQLYMNKDEVVKTLFARAKIDPGFTTLVWQKLEEENTDFFRAYYIRLKLKRQILLFNHLLEHQYHMMKYPLPTKIPLAPIQNGVHPMPVVLINKLKVVNFDQMRTSAIANSNKEDLPQEFAHNSRYSFYAVNNLPMGYPVLQKSSIPAAGQPHLDSMGSGISSCHVVNGVPASSNSHPIRISGNGAPVIPPNSAMSSLSEMPVSPTSVASNGHFPFTPSEISGMGTDTSILDTAFTSDVASSVGLQLAPDNGTGISRSLDQIQWNFSLSDLTADLSNLGVDDFFANTEPPGSPSDEEKS
ncbi:hypothetical protein JHK87_054602 [Glycine soja]|nr:hypothetical protein JHK87_054602 [Glycine soja]